ncbi:MAG: choice-of-anchor tandem repeat GloVer-containing protein [Limisphaerales bacterium]
MTELVLGRKPGSAPLMRLLWAAVLAVHVFRAQAGVIFTNLYSFTGTNDGANPYAGLVQGSDGSLYGTASSGGQNNLGTVYKLSTNGALTRLYSFDGTNGAAPYATLVQGRDGSFYGTTYAGGVSNLGTIFQFTTNGTLTSLFSFTGTNHPYQGANPAAALVQASDGSFYGTAEYGGWTNASYDGYGFGSVFQLTSKGTVAFPAVFGNTNGAYPAGGLVLGRDGSFYGTTTWGGKGIIGSFPGYGTVFKLAPDGTFTNIYLFTGAADGGFIYAGLVQGRDDYLYGAAFSGGSDYGTLFKVSTNGTFLPLHTFSRSDSGSPYGGMTEGSDGNFYGTTYGAYAGFGSVFSVTPSGAFTNLLFFNSTNGANPVGVLVQGADGNFYGTTSAGGANGLGTVFQLSVPLPPVIQTLTLTNGTVTLAWSAVAGQTYQPQYSDDLTPTNWTPLAKPSVANSGVMTSTDSNGFSSSAHRFYRVVLE